jgi:hypothetical protein
MGDAVTISQGALMLGTAIVGALVAAIGLLFRTLLASKDAQIKREAEISDRTLKSSEEQTEQLKRAIDLVERVSNRGGA